MGLRERKKQRQRDEILRAAARLAAERGFSRLRVRDLIGDVEISEATFFNYFPSKAALLDAWLEDELANAFAKAGASGRTLRAGVRQCVRELAHRARTAEGLGGAAWREARVHRAACAAAARAPLAGRVAEAAEAGELRRDIAPDELARLLACAVACAIAEACCAGGDAAASGVRACDVVLDGARRRHERVRVGAPAPSRSARA